MDDVFVFLWKNAKTKSCSGKERQLSEVNGVTGQEIWDENNESNGNERFAS